MNESLVLKKELKRVFVPQVFTTKNLEDKNPPFFTPMSWSTLSQGTNSNFTPLGPQHFWIWGAYGPSKKSMDRMFVGCFEVEVNLPRDTQAEIAKGCGTHHVFT